MQSSFVRDSSLVIRGSDRFVNENQDSHSRTDDTHSPARNGASLRQSPIVSCYN
jgi:hypothetical protein